MRTLWLDYQARRPGQGWPGWTTLVVTLMTAVTLTMHFLTLQRDVDVLEARVAKSQRLLDRQRATQTASDDAPALGTELAKRLAAHGPEKWEALFATLESAADDTVTLVSLTPGASEWLLSGEAKDLKATTRYTERLQATPLLHALHLVDYEVDRSHPQRPIRFTATMAQPGASN